MRPRFVDLAVGRQIRAYRVARALSVMDLASRCGIEPTEFDAIETGHFRPTPEMLVQLATALDVSVASFFLGLETSNEANSDGAGDASELSSEIIDFAAFRRKHH